MGVADEGVMTAVGADRGCEERDTGEMGSVTGAYIDGSLVIGLLKWHVPFGRCNLFEVRSPPVLLCPLQFCCKVVGYHLGYPIYQNRKPLPEEGVLPCFIFSVCLGPIY
jgi:hypothetical protein